MQAKHLGHLGGVGPAAAFLGLPYNANCVFMAGAIDGHIATEEINPSEGLEENSFRSVFWRSVDKLIGLLQGSGWSSLSGQATVCTRDFLVTQTMFDLQVCNVLRGRITQKHQLLALISTGPTWPNTVLFESFRQQASDARVLLPSEIGRHSSQRPIAAWLSQRAAAAPVTSCSTM